MFSGEFADMTRTLTALSSGIGLAGHTDAEYPVATRRPIRSRLLLVAALGVGTAALSAATLYRAISTTTFQRIERAHEAIQEELTRLQADGGAGREPGLAGASYVVGMRAGLTASLNDIAPHVPVMWQPFMNAMAVRAAAGAADGEISLPGGHLVARIEPAAGGRYAWAAMAVKPSPTLQVWRWLVGALTVSALLLVLCAADALITVKRGTGALQGALNALARDLSATMPATSVQEFGDIADGIAELARHLAEARRIQERLGRDLARQERLAALGRVVAGVAHEVRNPLASIKLRLDLAMTNAGALSEDLKRAIEHASSEIARLDRLVADLLIVSGRPLGPRRTVSAGELVRARVEVLAPWAAEKGVTMRADGDGRVNADPDALGRAIDNLLRNAVEASAPGALVTASVRQEAGGDGAQGLRIAVEDRGAGVSPTRAVELFEPFFTTKADGTGLGLAISRGIARAHGGDLTYARGAEVTRFELTLPAPPEMERAGEPARGAA
jgi:signal transduction histidine kinase